MLTMDAFRGDAFSATSLTAAVDRMGYVPGVLEAIPGLFQPVPVRTEHIWIEERDNAPALIQTSPRGAAPGQKGGDIRKGRNFKTVRLALASRITASELQGIRAFGSETETKALQGEVGRRQMKIKQDHQLTKENLRLGCVQGVVKDADGSTIYDWATEFGQAIPTEIDWDLDNAAPASGVLRKKCNDVRRVMLRALKGLGGSNVSIWALCGDAFWDDLTAHKEVRETFLNWTAAAALREGNAWQSFPFGSINWLNYRGTDDGTTVGINTDKAKFFPVGAGIFQWAMSPGESFEFANTPGKDDYSMVVMDKDRDMFADVEVYSYPLPVCTMPSALHQGRRT